MAWPAVGQFAHHCYRPLHLLRRAKGGRAGRLHQDPQRLRRCRRAAGGDLARGREWRPADAQRVCRHHLGQRRQAVQHLSAQRLHRRRRRCRSGVMGCLRQPDLVGQDPAQPG